MREISKIRLCEQLGSGGNGIVHAARIGSGEEFAAKLWIQNSNQQDPFVLSRNERERRIHALVAKHTPYVPQLFRRGAFPLYDAESKRLPVETDILLMQRLRGESLTSLLDRAEPSAELILTVAQQVGGALRVMHELGIAHRDVKPGNIFVAERRVYLADFGSAVFVEDGDPYMQEGFFTGSARYAAPESIRNNAITTAGDVYSLAVTFSELLGKYPYLLHMEVDKSLAAHLEDSPDVLGKHPTIMQEAAAPVLLKALYKDPNNRPTVQSFVNEFIQEVGIALLTEKKQIRSVPNFVRGRASVIQKEVLEEEKDPNLIDTITHKVTNQITATEPRKENKINRKRRIGLTLAAGIIGLAGVLGIHQDSHTTSEHAPNAEEGIVLQIPSIQTEPDNDKNRERKLLIQETASAPKEEPQHRRRVVIIPEHTSVARRSTSSPRVTPSSPAPIHSDLVSPAPAVDQSAQPSASPSASKRSPFRRGTPAPSPSSAPSDRKDCSVTL